MQAKVQTSPAGGRSEVTARAWPIFFFIAAARMLLGFRFALLDQQIDFLAMHRDLARRADPQPDLVAADIQYLDFDRVTDLDLLFFVS
jgi:hypothetical protein